MSTRQGVLWLLVAIAVLNVHSMVTPTLQQAPATSPHIGVSPSSSTTTPTASISQCNNGKLGKLMIQHGFKGKMLGACSQMESIGWSQGLEVENPYFTCCCMACGGLPQGDSAKTCSFHSEEASELTESGTKAEGNVEGVDKITEPDAGKAAAMRQCYQNQGKAMLAKSSNLENFLVDQCSFLPSDWKPNKAYSDYNECICLACSGSVSEKEVTTDSGYKKTMMVCGGVTLKDEASRTPAVSDNDGINQCNKVEGKAMISAHRFNELIYKCESLDDEWSNGDQTNPAVAYNRCICGACKYEVSDHGGKSRCEPPKEHAGKGLLVKGKSTVASSDASTTTKTLEECNAMEELTNLKANGHNRTIGTCDDTYATWVWPTNGKNSTPYYRCVCKACKGRIMVDEAQNEHCDGHKHGFEGVFSVGHQEFENGDAKSAVEGSSSSNSNGRPVPKCSFDKELSKFLKAERTQGQVMSAQGFVNTFVKRKEMTRQYPTPGSEPPALAKAVKDDEAIYYFAYRYANSVNKIRKKILAIQTNPLYDIKNCDQFRNFLQVTFLRHLSGMMVDSNPVLGESGKHDYHRYSEKPIYTLMNGVKMRAQMLHTNGGDWSELNMAVKRSHMVAVHETTVWAGLYKYLHKNVLNGEILTQLKTSDWLMYLPYSTLWKPEEIEQVSDELASKSGYTIADGINYCNEELAKMIGYSLDATNIEDLRGRFENEMSKLNTVDPALLSANMKMELDKKKRAVQTQMRIMNDVDEVLSRVGMEVATTQRSMESNIKGSVNSQEKAGHRSMATLMQQTNDEVRSLVEKGVQTLPSDTRHPELDRIKDRSVDIMTAGLKLDKTPLTEAVASQIRQQKEEREAISKAVENQKKYRDGNAVTSLVEVVEKGGEDSSDGKAATVLGEVSDVENGGNSAALASGLEPADSGGDVLKNRSPTDLQTKDNASEASMEKVVEHSMLVKARREYAEKMNEMQVSFEAVDILTPEHLEVYALMMKGRCNSIVTGWVQKMNADLKKIHNIDFQFGLDVESTLSNVRHSFMYMKDDFDSKIQATLKAHHDIYQKLLSDPDSRYTELNGDYQNDYRDKAVEYVGLQREELDKVRKLLASYVHNTADVVTDFLSEQNDEVEQTEDSTFWSSLHEKTATAEAADRKDFATRLSRMMSSDEGRREVAEMGFERVRIPRYLSFVSEPEVDPEAVFSHLEKIRCPVGFARAICVVVIDMINVLERTYHEAVQAGLNEIPTDIPDRPIVKSSAQQTHGAIEAAYDGLEEEIQPVLAGRAVATVSFANDVENKIKNLAAASALSKLESVATQMDEIASARLQDAAVDEGARVSLRRAKSTRGGGGLVLTEN